MYIIKNQKKTTPQISLSSSPLPPNEAFISLFFQLLTCTLSLNFKEKEEYMYIYKQKYYLLYTFSIFCDGNLIGLLRYACLCYTFNLCFNSLIFILFYKSLIGVVCCMKNENNVQSINKSFSFI